MSKERKWVLVLLAIILTTGIFLRTYHFGNWLLFEIDQTYDTRIVSQAIEQGIGDLPLLGPTAGGGRALRLGPAFYYLEYLSAAVFGNTPVGHAMLVLVFSILTLPLFYLFCRRYFDTSVSLSLLALLSGSAFLVLYGRFSWSPNVLPFLTLLSFYALLRSVSPAEPKRDRYFLFAAAAIGITSQIHFNAFFTIPVIAIIFLLYKRPRFPWKTWLMACGIVAVIYSPMAMSDVVTHGENIGLFFKKVAKGGASAPFKDIFHQSVVDLQYTASNYFFIDSGIDRINGGRLKGYGFQNDAALPWRLFAIGLFLTEIALLIWNFTKETVAEKKDFLILVFLWTSIPFAYFYSLLSSNFQIYPRFFLLVAPIAIILLGLLFEKLRPVNNTTRLVLLVSVTLLFLIPNLSRINEHFLKLATPVSTGVETEDIFPDDSRLTLKEQLAITDYLVVKQAENGLPLYLSTSHEYEPVFWYHLAKRGIPYFSTINDDVLAARANYFLIQYPKDGKAGIERIFRIEDKRNFGALTVYTLSPRPEKIKTLRPSPTDRTLSEQTLQIQELKTWKSLFQR